MEVRALRRLAGGRSGCMLLILIFACLICTTNANLGMRLIVFWSISIFLSI
jgi:hypothetical protein